MGDAIGPYHAVLLGEVQACAGEVAIEARPKLWPAFVRHFLRELELAAEDCDEDGEAIDMGEVLRAIRADIDARLTSGAWGEATD